MKKNTVLFLLISFFSLDNFAQNEAFSLADFYTKNAKLEQQTDSIFGQLTEEARIAQMIITSAGQLGKTDAEVIDLARKNQIGGVVFLKGSRQSHRALIDALNTVSRENKSIPLIFSIDAEPSLFNGRIGGTSKMMKTIDIKTTHQSDSIATVISDELLRLGFHHNFAPVVDVSPNNEAIKLRSFGNNQDTIISLSKAFIEATQRNNIVATAKHFPGHGMVKGDTHKQSVYIDGELQELGVYPPLIADGVIAIMVAHITIRNNQKYNTEGLPSTCSRKIVTGLLREELGFEGIVITDALNIMKAVTILDKAPLLASQAGCDMILMPIDEGKTAGWILDAMQNDDAYKEQVYASVKKIIRLKICLGLI